MNEAEIESELQRKGSTSRRITPDDLDALIGDVAYHTFPGTTTTVCCLTLTNGFTVVGDSACVDKANFDPELGRKIARNEARDKIWILEGYRLNCSN
jgi:hypothetical protein